jgi:hypothetical protein
MFRDAARQYWSLKCNVGGGNDVQKGKLHGLGCLLTPRHILTAGHVWENISDRYSWPVVLKHDGLFRCTVLHHDPGIDLMLLQCTDKLAPGELSEPASFPAVYPDFPWWGQSVGFLTSLHLTMTGPKPRSCTSFSQASVSMFVNDEESRNLFVLDGGTIQKGSSGGPVFTAKGELVGVIVQSFQFVPDQDHPLPHVVTLPVMSAVLPLNKMIAELKKSTGG